MPLKGFATFLFATVMAAPAHAQEATDWGAAARGDIEAAYALYRDNHPGWENPGDPKFRDLLQSARDTALQRAATVKNETDYIRTLGAFSAVLGDGHARLVRSNASGAVTPGVVQTWPGFVPAWRGNALLVHSVAPGFPFAPGTRIVRCNGQPIKAWIRERGLESAMRFAEGGQWWSRTPAMMTGRSDAPPPAEACTFVGSDGQEVEQALQWQPAPEDLVARRLAATDGTPDPIGLTEPAPGLFWVSMPSFSPDATGQAAYEKLFADLAARRSEMASARAVVLDLRGNDGGSSAWSEKVAQALWGEEAVERRKFDYFAGVSVWYRASAANTAYVDTWLDLFKDDAAMVAQVRPVAEAMHKHLDAGEPFHVIRDEADDIARAAAKSPATDFTTPVYVITPGRCASACLDAVDTFTLFGNTSLVGAPTSGDTVYMEVRSEELPSGKGRIVIPIKFWHQRPRESGEVYQPRLRVDDLDWSSATFLRAIEKDLGPAG